MNSKSNAFIVVALVLISVLAVTSFSANLSGAPSGSPPPASFQLSPVNLKFTFSVASTWGGVDHVGDSFVATVQNFPAFQQVQVYIGPMVVASMSTNSTGYGTTASTIPAMPGGNYVPVAEVASQGLFADSAQITVAPYFEVTDPAGNLLNATSGSYEYVPVNGSLTVRAYGLSPGTAYDAFDQFVAPSGVYASHLVTSISAGTTSPSGIYPAADGTLTFTYRAYYTTQVTASVSTITLSSGVSGYRGDSFAYRTIGKAVVSSPSSFFIALPGSNQTLTVTGLIPSGAKVYPGVSDYYSAYIGGSIISLTSSGKTSTTLSTTTGTLTGYFSAPPYVGLFALNITYYGSSYTSSIGSSYLVISSPGVSAGSGTLSVVSLTTGYEAIGYGYESSPAPMLYYMAYSGSHAVGAGITDGAFAASFTPGGEPAGTYSVFTVVTVSSTNYFVYSSYTVSSVLKLSSVSGTLGTTLTGSASGLLPNTYYSVLFGNVAESPSSPLLSDGTGTVSSMQIYVPDLPAGNYTVSLVQLGATRPTVSTMFHIVPNKNITFSTSSAFAFPGQIVQFTVSSLTAPISPVSQGFSVISEPAYSVTISLNGTPYDVVPAALASGVLSGSFNMPNNASGTYYMVTFTANETVSGTYRAGSNTSFATITLPFTGAESTSIELVSGNGAYILGVSQSQITQIDSSINATLSVPLSQLNAAITSINGNVATITTDFGTMTATLNSINATVLSVQSGVAHVETTIGSLNVSLANLNASVMLFHNDMTVLNTSLGQELVSLNAINTTVSITNGKIATIETDLGTFTGNVTSVSNGIATIQTKLGNIQANTNQIVPTGGTSFLLEIIILIVVIISVVFSAIAFSAVRDIRNRFGMKKE